MLVYPFKIWSKKSSQLLNVLIPVIPDKRFLYVKHFM